MLNVYAVTSIYNNIGINIDLFSFQPFVIIDSSVYSSPASQSSSVRSFSIFADIRNPICKSKILKNVIVRYLWLSSKCSFPVSFLKCPKYFDLPCLDCNWSSMSNGVDSSLFQFTDLIMIRCKKFESNAQLKQTHFRSSKYYVIMQECGKMAMCWRRMNERVKIEQPYTYVERDYRLLSDFY